MSISHTFDQKIYYVYQNKRKQNKIKQKQVQSKAKQKQNKQNTKQNKNKTIKKKRKKKLKSSKVLRYHLTNPHNVRRSKSKSYKT